MKNKFALMVGMLLIMILPMISALDTITFKQNDVVDIKAYCSYNGNACDISSAICNISITYPNSSMMVSNQLMTNNPGGIENYTLNDSSTIGEYNAYMYCIQNGTASSSSWVFTINPTGYAINSSKTGMMYTPIIILVILEILLFIFGLYVQNTTMKIFVMSLVILMIVFTIGYILQMMQSTIGEFTSLTSMFSSVYVLAIILLGTGAILIILYLIVISFKAFYKTRGLIPDMDGL
jgi:hypothetical protein